ncbi:MAG TPA: IS3 family transposase [Clostridium sp.]
MTKIKKHYTDEFRNTLVELYNSGKSLADLSREYGIAKSTVTVWINKSKPIVVGKDKTITTAEYQQMLKKMARLEEENEILKKGHCYIRKEITNIFNFISNNRKQYHIKIMCKVLNVARSSYYKSLSKKKSKREIENKTIENQILEIYTASKKCYGSPKINISLKEFGTNISLKRTQRIMKKLGIRSIIIKKYRPTSSKDKVVEKVNVIKRDFSTNTINEKWVTDITYIYTIKDGWCYLASVMDLHTRKIIGHSMSKYIDTALALQAVKNALELQRPTSNLILHSDLGTQYTSLEFKEYILNTKIITHSFSGKGCPYDNACIESFHASLKKEEVYRVTYYDFNVAKLSIFQYIESWYNRRRIHGSIGYISPQKCEDMARKIS